LTWKLAAAFIAVGCICFVAGLAWAACFEAREREWLGTRADSTPSNPDEDRTASITILETPHPSQDTGAEHPRPRNSEHPSVIRIGRSEDRHATQ
jgi:hypothetical protein